MDKRPLRVPEDWFIFGLVLSLCPFFISGMLMLAQLYSARAAGNPRWWAQDFSVELPAFGISGIVLAVVLWLRLASGVRWMERPSPSQQVQRRLLPQSPRRLWLRAAASIVMVAVFIGLKVVTRTGEFNPIPGGSGDGLSLRGHFFGVFHLFGKDWTGIELGIIAVLLALLLCVCWSGVKRTREQNQD
jgi:hypothetical protein